MRVLFLLALSACSSVDGADFIEPFDGVEHRINIEGHGWRPSASAEIACLSLDDDGVARATWLDGADLHSSDLGNWQHVEDIECGAEYLVDGQQWTVTASRCETEPVSWRVDMGSAWVNTFPGLPCSE